MTQGGYPPPQDDWWRVGPGNQMCRMCGEERLVSKVEDFRGVQLFCAVCANSWWLKRNGSTDETG